MKLYYFAFRARGEPIKMLLAHAGVDYESVVVTGETWPALKPTIPPNHAGKNQVPFLELDDGTKLPESLDIAKFIVKNHAPNLAGSTAEIQSKADELWKSCDVVGYGSINPILNFFDVGTAEERIPDFITNTLPKTMTYLSTELGDGPYFCNELTYTDFCIFHYLNGISTLDGGVTMSKHANLVEWYKKVETMDSMAKYLKERPAQGSVGREGCLLRSTKPPSELEVVKKSLGKLSS